MLQELTFTVEDMINLLDYPPEGRALLKAAAGDGLNRPLTFNEAVASLLGNAVASELPMKRVMGLLDVVTDLDVGDDEWRNMRVIINSKTAHFTVDDADAEAVMDKMCRESGFESVAINTIRIGHLVRRLEEYVRFNSLMEEAPGS